MPLIMLKFVASMEIVNYQTTFSVNLTEMEAKTNIFTFCQTLEPKVLKIIMSLEAPLLDSLLVTLPSSKS